MAPQTGFELTGAWTTLAEETAFLETVAAETTALLTVAGHTVNGTPIHRLDLGTGTSQTMLIVTLQHGNEQASREAALSQLRDLAYSIDPATLAYLAAHRIVYLTNVNADGLPTRRNNTNGINLNRDYVRLTQPESRAVTDVIRDAAPHMIVDAHEYFTTGDEWWGYPGGLPATHPDIAALEQDCFDAGVSTLTSLDYTAGYYPVWSMPKAGLSTLAAAHHAVGMLSETRAYDEPPHRVAVQRIILDMFRDWHQTNAAACTAASQASRQWAAATTDTYPLIVGEYIGRETPQRLDIIGYQLAEALPGQYLDTFGIHVEPDGFVPINQAARVVIPMLLDPDSIDAVTPATRVARQNATTPPHAYRVRVGGQTRDVIAIRHHTGGKTRDIAMPSPVP